MVSGYVTSEYWECDYFRSLYSIVTLDDAQVGHICHELLCYMMDVYCCSYRYDVQHCDWSSHSTCSKATPGRELGKRQVIKVSI